MGFEENHTISCRPPRDRKQVPQQLEDDRCSLLGSSFHVPSVATLLAPLLVDCGLLDKIPSAQEILEKSMGCLEDPARPSEVSMRAALALDLASSAIHGGQDARVDASSAMPPDAWPRRAVPADRWTWQLVWRRSWHRSPDAFITNLEAIAGVAAFSWRLREGHRCGVRAIHLVDNQATLGVLARGRSSSKLLNRQARRLGAICILGRIVPVFAYVSTTDNPADRGSRLTDRRSPKRVRLR